MKRSCLVLILVIFSLNTCAVNPAERNNAGGVLYNQGDYANAVNAYQAAQVLSPDVPEPYFNAASALAQQGNLEDAVATLHQALKTSDEALTEKAYYNLGNIYFEMTSYEDAVHAYQQALLIMPDDEDARYNLELALSHIQPPSPTPEDQGRLENTPTPQPADQNGNLPTPSLEAATPTPQSDASQPVDQTPPPAENTMTVEQSLQLLDSIQQDQNRLPEKQPTLSGSSQLQKDW
jgi:tetratricopeptide (TPR) repeat protein